MLRRSIIFKALSDRDLNAFHQLMFRRATSVDCLHGWLGKRGVRISRSAVGRYWKAWRDEPRLNSIGSRNEPPETREMGRLVGRLSKAQVRTLLDLAEFLAARNGVAADDA